MVSELVLAAVPGVDRFPRDVAQRPAFAGFHAGLVDLAAEHVVVVGMTMRPSASLTSRWLPSMSKSTRVGKTRPSVGRVVALMGSNRLWAMLRNVRPSASAWATVGVAAWSAALVAASCSSGPAPPVCAARTRSADIRAGAGA